MNTTSRLFYSFSNQYTHPSTSTAGNGTPPVYFEKAIALSESQFAVQTLVDSNTQEYRVEIRNVEPPDMSDSVTVNTCARGFCPSFRFCGAGPNSSFAYTLTNSTHVSIWWRKFGQFPLFLTSVDSSSFGSCQTLWPYPTSSLALSFFLLLVPFSFIRNILFCIGYAERNLFSLWLC